MAEKRSLSNFSVFKSAFQKDEIIVRAIFATDLKGVLGYGNDLIFHNPEDMVFFKAKTMGKIVVMGHKTFLSMNSTPLPGRVNVVITRHPDKREGDWKLEHPEPLKDGTSLYFISAANDIVTISRETEIKDVWIIGGSHIYELFRSFYHTICITEYRCNVAEDGKKLGLIQDSKFYHSKLRTWNYFTLIKHNTGTQIAKGDWKSPSGDSIRYTITSYVKKIPTKRIKAIQKGRAQEPKNYGPLADYLADHYNEHIPH